MSERPVVFSASSVNAYLDCHLAWYFAYVLGAESAESEPQRVGIQVHDYAEKKLQHIADQYIVADTSPRPEVKALLRVFDRDILPTYRNPILIEAPFQLEVNGIGFSGILDAVDEQDVPWGFELLLRDTKTTGSRPPAGRYRFAMIGYKLGAEDLLGRTIAAAQLDWIVRTKNPYYWPEAMDPITDDDVALFAATLEGVAELVDQGDYEPTALGTWKCKACNYAAICGPYQRFKEVTDGGNA